MNSPAVEAVARNKKLDVLFEELLKQSDRVTRENWWGLVKSNDHLRERAWDQYKKANPPEDELLNKILLGQNCVVRTYLAALLVEITSNEKTLVSVMEKVVEASALAATKLIKLKSIGGIAKIFSSDFGQVRACHDDAVRAVLEMTEPNVHLLRAAICSRDVSSAENKFLVAEKLLGLDQDLQTYRAIVYSVPRLAGKVWEKKESFDQHTLMTFVQSKIEPYAGEAASRIIAMTDQFSPLFEVMRLRPELREKGWARLNKESLSETWLLAIQRDMPEMTGKTIPYLVKIREAQAARTRTPETIISDINSV